jgi:hypothetical protein
MFSLQPPRHIPTLPNEYEGMTMTMIKLSDDLMRGIPAIAEFLGKSPKEVYNQAKRGHWPLFKVGDVWHGRRTTLIAHIRKLENGEVV